MRLNRIVRTQLLFTMLAIAGIAEITRSSLCTATPQTEVPKTTLSPDVLRFGNQAIRVPSAPQLVKLTNTSSKDLTIFEVTSSSAEFRKVHDCPLAPNPLSPGSSCTIMVRFIPAALGLRTASLNVRDNRERKALGIVALQGTGVVSRVELSRTNVVFPPQLVGTTSRAQIVNLANQSTTPLKIGTISADGSFTLAQVPKPCSATSTVAPGTSCNLGIAFSPSGAGIMEGRVMLLDSDVASPHQIALTGTATAVTLSAARLSFPTVNVGETSLPQEVQFTNAGSSPIAIKDINVVGDFSQQNTCSREIPSHNSCLLKVTFKPTLGGRRIGIIRIFNSDPTRMQPLYLLGTGTTMSVSQTKLSFNDQKVGTTSAPQVLTFTNHGSTILNISGFTLTGDFLMPAKTCTSKLAPGESCTVQVAFFPSAEGGVMGTLIVEENGTAADQRISINLSGIGK